MRAEPVTYTITQKNCKHKNGWYQRIYFKFWLFQVSKVMFICQDCTRAIDK